MVRTNALRLLKLEKFKIFNHPTILKINLSLLDNFKIIISHLLTKTNCAPQLQQQLALLLIIREFADFLKKRDASFSLGPLVVKETPAHVFLTFTDPFDLDFKVIEYFVGSFPEFTDEARVGYLSNVLAIKARVDKALLDAATGGENAPLPEHIHFEDLVWANACPENPDFEFTTLTYTTPARRTAIKTFKRFFYTFRLKKAAPLSSLVDEVVYEIDNLRDISALPSDFLPKLNQCLTFNWGLGDLLILRRNVAQIVKKNNALHNSNLGLHFLEEDLLLTQLEHQYERLDYDPSYEWLKPKIEADMLNLDSGPKNKNNNDVVAAPTTTAQGQIPAPSTPLAALGINLLLLDKAKRIPWLKIESSLSYPVYTLTVFADLVVLEVAENLTDLNAFQQIVKYALKQLLAHNIINKISFGAVLLEKHKTRLAPLNTNANMRKAFTIVKNKGAFTLFGNVLSPQERVAVQAPRSSESSLTPPTTAPAVSTRIDD
jgi:hypothetical protein